MAGEDRVARCGEVRLRYRDEGAGPALLLIHGVGSRLEAWDEVTPLLAERWRVVRADLRGHGESDKPAGPYELDDFMNDLVGLLDGLGVARSHVLGFSLGGLVAQGLALDHPRRVDHLILLSTVAGRNEEERRRVEARLQVVEQGIPGDHFRNSVSRWFTDEFVTRHPEVIDAAERANKANDPKAYAAAYRVLATTDLADRLSGIAAPTLVATGEEDIGSNTRMARLMAERIPDARLHVFPGMRHSLVAEIPGEVARVVAEFLPAPQD